MDGCAENAFAINTAINTPEAAVKAQAEAQRKRSVAKALTQGGSTAAIPSSAQACTRRSWNWPRNYPLYLASR
jgi:hypothetical protein